MFDASLPITYKYMHSIADCIESGFRLSIYHGAPSSTLRQEEEEEGVVAPSSGSGVADDLSTAAMTGTETVTVLRCLCPGHALVRAAVDILRTCKAFIKEEEAEVANMTGETLAHSLTLTACLR